MVDDLIGSDLYDTLLRNVFFEIETTFKQADFYTYYGAVRKPDGPTSELYLPGCVPELVATFILPGDLPSKPLSASEVKKPELIVKFIRPDEEINAKQVENYKNIPSVKAILQIYVTDRNCVVWQDRNGWKHHTTGAEIHLDEWLVMLTVRDFYTNVNL